MIDRLLRYLNAISFQRGLALGAFVGAAIAGSTLWSRLREARELRVASRPEQAPGPPTSR